MSRSGYTDDSDSNYMFLYRSIVERALARSVPTLHTMASALRISSLTTMANMWTLARWDIASPSHRAWPLRSCMRTMKRTTTPKHQRHGGRACAAGCSARSRASDGADRTDHLAVAGQAMSSPNFCPRRDAGHAPLDTEGPAGDSIMRGFTSIGYTAVVMCRHCGLVYWVQAPEESALQSKR